jgi:hypothetical protein
LVRAGTISNLDQLYGGGVTGNLLNGFHNGDPRVYQWLQNRHKKHNHLIDEEGIYHFEEHSWKVPYGVRVALQRPLVSSQLSHRYPWYVTWRSPKTGKRLKKFMPSLPSAIHLIATRVQYVDPQACVVSRLGYHVPTALAGKIPAPWKWCPCCMTARKFYRTYPEQQFFADRKEWSEEKQRYTHKERRVYELHCKICGITNRNLKFRRSNQPWERRRIRSKVRRVRRRR